MAHHETKKAFLKPIDKTKNYKKFVKDVDMKKDHPKVKHYHTDGKKHHDGENVIMHKLLNNHDNYTPDLDFNALDKRGVLEILNPFHFQQNWKSFRGHVDDCHSCQFNYKTCVLLILSS